MDKNIVIKEMMATVDELNAATYNPRKIMGSSLKPLR